MSEETFRMIMDFYKLLNQLYNKDIISYIQYTDVLSALFDKMLYLYENGDPLDKCY